MSISAGASILWSREVLVFENLALFGLRRSEIGLQVQLVIRLDWNEAHLFAVDCLCDSFRIDEVVLIHFTKGFTS